MTDYNAYIEDELQGKNDPVYVDRWKEVFEETLPTCTPELQQGIALLQEIEANVATVTRLHGKYKTRFEIAHPTSACTLSFYTDEWPLMDRKIQIRYSTDSNKLHIVKLTFNKSATVDEGTKAAIAALSHLA